MKDFDVIHRAANQLVVIQSKERVYICTGESGCAYVHHGNTNSRGGGDPR